jgi:hypothetical protein
VKHANLIHLENLRKQRLMKDNAMSQRLQNKENLIFIDAFISCTSTAIADT